MNHKSFVIVAAFVALFAAGLLSVGVFQSDAKTGAADPVPATSPQENSAWEYARLVVNGQQVTWLIGDTNLEPRTQTIAQTNQQLGGKQARANLSNLLNTIGLNGWELVNVNGKTWIFKRVPTR